MNQDLSHEKVKCTHCGATNKSHHRYCFECGFELPKLEARPIVIETAPKKSNTMRIVLTVLAATFVVFIVIGISGYFFFKGFAVDKVLSTMSIEINKTCPVMVDSETRLDKTEALHENMMEYYYTLVNLEKSSINVDLAVEQLKEVLLKNVKESEQLKTLKVLETTFKYSYNDKNGVHLFSVSITPEDYQQ